MDTELWVGRRKRTTRDLARAAIFVVPVALAPIARPLTRFHIPIDLSVYRAAGMKVAAFLGESLYANHWTALDGRLLGPTAHVTMPFTYPPFAALLAVPLAAMRPGPAFIVWSLMCVALVVWLTAVAFRPLIERLTWGRWLALAALAAVVSAMVPVASTLAYGQVNLIIMTLCVLDLLVLTGHRGRLIGIATAIKLTPALFIAYYAVTGRWREARRALGTAAACSAAAFVLLPHASIAYWTHPFQDVHRIGSATYYSNQSLNGLIRRLDAPGWLWLPFALVAAVVGLRRARDAHRLGSERAAVALVGLTALLVSPISWEHHAVWIILVLAAIAADGTNRRRIAVAIGVLIVFLVPLPRYGAVLVHEDAIPVLTQILQNAYVIAYAALIFLLPISSSRAKEESVAARVGAMAG